MTWRRMAQLVPSCVVLGIGVGLLLLTALGSDGYSTLINGITIATGAPFVVVNASVGVVFVGLAWARGMRPGLGTIVQPLVVGLTINTVLSLGTAPQQLAPRVVMLLVAFATMAFGVAGYLGSGLGAGPAESAALAWDPPVRFRWSYSVLQGGGALVGWLLGAAIGPGTLLVVFLLGPVVDLLTAKLPVLTVRRPDAAPECG